MGCIDFHTHAFPDALARRAVASLEESGNITAYSDGTIKGLLASMDAASIERAVLCSIATRPGQFGDILAWSAAVRSERIIPLPSVHPRDEQHLAHVRQVHAQGFAGLYHEIFNERDAAPVFAQLESWLEQRCPVRRK